MDTLEDLLRAWSDAEARGGRTRDGKDPETSPTTSRAAEPRWSHPADHSSAGPAVLYLKQADRQFDVV
jgi:hypothetical protein